MGKKYLLSAFFLLLSLYVSNYNSLRAQSLIDFSKYKITQLSKSTKFNCSAFRITIPIDFNNDGSIDFVTTGDDMGPCGTNGEISYLNFFENDGKDNYNDKTAKYAKDSLWVIRPNWFLVEDFNGDGKKDIFITGEQIHQQWDVNYLKIYPFLKPNIDIDTMANFTFVQRRHHLYLTQSDGTFKDSPEFLQGMRLGSVFGITAVDYNKDGYMDLVNAVQQFSNNDKLKPSGWDIEFFINNGGKSMTRTTPFTVRDARDANNNVFNKSRIDSLGGNYEGPENIKLFDVNNDGYFDLIFNDREGNALCMKSQNKPLDLYSPIIKFDDFQRNGLLSGMPGSKIGIRSFYIVDLKKDGTNQLIEYWANGGGDFQPGKKLYQLIKVFDIKNGELIDATGNYFKTGENIGTTYGSGLLGLVDIDNDGFVDLYPKNIDHDGTGWQGFNGNDSTMYFKNINGKFSLKSMGLKYYFKEFKELADSMKVYKYDEIHKFSIANSLIPINTGKTNKLIFYSYGTDPGIESDKLKQYSNQFFFNQQNKVRNDSLNTSFKGFILSLDKGPDNDNDGIADSEDNCQYMYNPNQEDLDNNNIGDACEWSPILLKKTVSILEDLGVNGSLSVGDFMLDSVSKYVTYGDGDYKTYFTIANNQINLKTSVSTYSKEFFKVPVKYNKSAVTINDTITIYIIRYLNWPKNTGKLQNGYIPYYYESSSNGMTGLENTKFDQYQYFGPANQAPFIITDLDKNGIKDIIGQSVQLWYAPYSDTSKSPTNIQRFGIPVYMKLDSSFNLTYYHENYRNPDVLLHQPDFYSQADINNDGKNEIINLGEHYHTEYFLGQQDQVFGKNVMKYLGMIENRDYNQQTAGKLNRYYTIENGRIIDKKEMYDYSNLKEIKSPELYITDQKFVSIFGSAIGDINNDKNIDYVTSIQGLGGYYIDILLNDGKGGFKVNRIKPETYGYNTGPEGHNMLIDINGDGYLDYFFGGSKKGDGNFNGTGFLGYVLNDKKGSFKIDSLKDIGSFGSTKIAPKYMYVDDLDKDNNNEIIVYRSTGLGSGGGVTDLEFVDDILILTVKNGEIINNTSKFIDTMSRSKMYSQDSYLYYGDLDGDKIKDLFVSYQVDSGIVHSYPFTGYWEKNYDGFTYFKGSKEGKFKYTRKEKFLYQDGFKNWYSKNENSGIFSNDFTPADLDNDGTAELIHHPFIAKNLIIFKLHNCNPPKPTFSTSKYDFCSGDSLKLTVSIINKGDSLKWYYGTKSDLTNVSNKTFTDSTKLFVIRTDSVGCVISSDTITITKNALPALPTVKDTVFCQNISSSTLLATGTSGNTITWYGTNAIGGTGNNTAVVAPTTDTTTKSYYVSQINNTTSCESPRAKITVKINPAPASPSVKDTAYCNNISADTLKATSLTGHSLNWYGTSATGGTASILGSKPITTTVGSFNYYVSQKNNTTGCEGARAKIGVTINPLPIAPVVRDTNYCNNASSDTIRLNASTGATLLWYGTNATGGTGSSTAIKPSTATVGAANYYLSQIITATGCEGPRSKVVVTTKPIPSAPSLSRDTANFLLSGAAGTTWYKDGSAITDTAQKYKPTAAGSYTAKTTTNGCTSVMSAAYYYLVTDIINLSKDEFIKLAPNPFINQLNFDFIVKGYQKLNIEVYDVATGSKVATQQNITAGTQIQLGQLARGTYIVRVTSNDNKIAQQFKMVKL
jgi:hypothetical protein